jgi:hypothetical protein
LVHLSEPKGYLYSSKSEYQAAEIHDFSFILSH